MWCFFFLFRFFEILYRVRLSRRWIVFGKVRNYLDRMLRLLFREYFFVDGCGCRCCYLFLNSTIVRFFFLNFRFENFCMNKKFIKFKIVYRVLGLKNSDTKNFSSINF